MQQVIIGLDTREMLSEMELLSRSEVDFGIEDVDDEDSDVDDDEDDDEDEDDENVNYEEVMAAVLFNL